MTSGQNIVILLEKMIDKKIRMKEIQNVFGVVEEQNDLQEDVRRIKNELGYLLDLI